MNLPEQKLIINGYPVFCSKLGEAAYWIRNLKIVIIFNTTALGDNVVVVGEDKDPSIHYSVEQIIDGLVKIREEQTK